MALSMVNSSSSSKKNNKKVSSSASICTASTQHSNYSGASSIISDLHRNNDDERSCLKEVQMRLRGVSLTGNSRDDAELEEIFDKVYRTPTNSGSGNKDVRIAANSSINEMHVLGEPVNCFVDGVTVGSLTGMDKNQQIGKLERLRSARRKMATEQAQNEINGTSYNTKNGDSTSARQKMLADFGI